MFEDKEPIARHMTSPEKEPRGWVSIQRLSQGSHAGFHAETLINMSAHPTCFVEVRGPRN